MDSGSLELSDASHPGNHHWESCVMLLPWIVGSYNAESDSLCRFARLGHFLPKVQLVAEFGGDEPMRCSGPSITRSPKFVCCEFGCWQLIR